VGGGSAAVGSAGIVHGNAAFTVVSLRKAETKCRFCLAFREGCSIFAD
jgi:hypothetical protein